MAGQLHCCGELSSKTPVERLRAHERQYVTHVFMLDTFCQPLSMFVFASYDVHSLQVHFKLSRLCVNPMTTLFRVLHRNNDVYSKLDGQYGHSPSLGGYCIFSSRQSLLGSSRCLIRLNQARAELTEITDSFILMKGDKDLHQYCLFCALSAHSSLRQLRLSPNL